MSFKFTETAPCRTADSWLFDQTNLDLAMPGLAYCARCIYWQECESLVEPQSSHYDGIVGGKVWRNGKILARLDSSSPNRLVVGEELHEDALEFRGSELLGNRYGDVLRGGETDDPRESPSEKDL